MKSYRTDSSGEITKIIYENGRTADFHESEIGLIVWILQGKLWSKIQLNNRLRSELWWRNRLQSIINSPPVNIENNLNPGIYDQDGIEIPLPIQFEIEIGMPDLNYEILLEAWKRVFPQSCDNA